MATSSLCCGVVRAELRWAAAHHAGTQIADVSSVAYEAASDIRLELSSGLVWKYTLQNEEDAQLCACAVRCIQVLHRLPAGLSTQNLDSAQS